MASKASVPFGTADAEVEKFLQQSKVLLSRPVVAGGHSVHKAHPTIAQNKNDATTTSQTSASDQGVIFAVAASTDFVSSVVVNKGEKRIAPTQRALPTIDGHFVSKENKNVVIQLKRTSLLLCNTTVQL
ncbi:hypothetical protein ACH5RR_037435 [Cinchona calisaya]|uniref:Uncharacterized protein n=1 Tax=Cinchona calisaya TaxID=153742 RepID=A0ABD2Y655_9GENT